jgi:hypothetical protein
MTASALCLYAGFPGSALGNSACRACSCACSAIYTLISIDFVMGISLRDCACRALTYTSSAAYTFIRNNVCHDTTSCI